MTTKKLTIRQKLLVAGTLFGMFFGAGNLIFPVHLGQMAGRNAIPAMIGFIITAVGIPVFGVAAIGITHSDGLQTLAGKVSKGYGIFFTCLLYLTIGPLFAIPRCATVSFTTGVAPMLGDSGAEWLYLLIFSAVFFAFVLFFSLPRQDHRLDRQDHQSYFPDLLCRADDRGAAGPRCRRVCRGAGGGLSERRIFPLSDRGLRHHGRHRRSGLRHRGD